MSAPINTSAAADQDLPGLPGLEIGRTRLDVDIIIPVYNEQRVLADSIARLHAFVSNELPFSWRIIIADNASTDETPFIAHRLSERLAGVRVLRLEQKGRGCALRTAWSQSSARVVCYMDVDLSTDLHALLPLLAPLLSGHSDVAIGTRLARGARVKRGVKRELISRSYNRVLHLALRARFSDAQCGFKAIRGDLLPGLLTQVQDEGWFFDTELLVLAQRQGLRIHEVPVDWVDDPDSRVDIMATVAADLRGVFRLQAQSRVLRFLAIGVLCTVAYAVLFLLLAGVMPTALASGLALATTAIGNTAANRRWTFALRGREQRVRQYAAGAVVFALTLGLTDGALALLHATDKGPSRALELSVLVVASLVATVTRYVALRSWVFAARRPRLEPPPQPNATVATPDPT
jgi:glycosyltransferase involved in cell wall biosynthesis